MVVGMIAHLAHPTVTTCCLNNSQEISFRSCREINLSVAIKPELPQTRTEEEKV